jgi:biopolymer transport protein ExbD
MTPWLEDMMNEKVELQIAPLIDVVFLLLIYFIATSTLKQSEADLGITLPGTLKQSTTISMPDEQIIEVLEDGRVILNGKDYGENGSKDLWELTRTLVRYRKASQAAKNKALITIQGEAEAIHERVIDVMNACAGAGIKNVTFGMGE